MFFCGYGEIRGWNGSTMNVSLLPGDFARATQRRQLEAFPALTWTEAKTPNRNTLIEHLELLEAQLGPLWTPRSCSFSLPGGFFADRAWTGRSADNKPVWCKLLSGCSAPPKPPRSGCWGTHPRRPPRLPHDLISALPALVCCIGTTFILNCNQLAQKNWTQSEACLKFSLLSGAAEARRSSPQRTTLGQEASCMYKTCIAACATAPDALFPCQKYRFYHLPINTSLASKSAAR